MALNEKDVEYAELLVARCHSGIAQTQAEAQQQLEQWAARSDEHYKYYLRLTHASGTLDNALDSLKQHYPRLVAAPPTLVEQLRPTAAPSRQRWWISASASMAALLLGIGLWLVDPELSHDDYHTTIGEHRLEQLADGSQVELNTDTRIRYAQHLRSRSVDLLQGEALFSVTHNPQRPFHVLSGSDRVTVLGTEFAVRQYPNGSLVTVLHGRVSVTPQDQQAQVVLTDGQQVRTQDGSIAGSIQPIDARLATSWRNGRIELNGLSLREGMNELQRYRTGAINIRDSKAARLRLTGSFSLDDPDLLLRTLVAVLPVRVQFRQNGSVDILSQ